MRKNRKNNSRTWGNRICIAAFLLTCSFMLGGCGVKKEKEADSELPKIVIGMDYFEPYSYQASDGEYKGIDVELAKEAFRIQIIQRLWRLRLLCEDLLHIPSPLRYLLSVYEHLLKCRLELLPGYQLP